MAFWYATESVALLAEGVDRNTVTTSSRQRSGVALLAEGVDRNILDIVDKDSLEVALLAEGVDRNQYQLNGGAWQTGSPSSRRAWIEMVLPNCAAHMITSPSSRRAWIEISMVLGMWFRWMVALLAEGVDRNYLLESLFNSRTMSPSSRRAWIEIAHHPAGQRRSRRRPPRGGRG